ncbi:MAG: zf-TFIIB domain-containing protein [Deltaproteobacteria bacterium]|nr:zf-TFIIB domain-containing protein [Deltaproteobacteria bacterium]
MSTQRVVCPGCQSLMQVLQLETAEVDYCLFCGGTYFDRGEIELILEHPLPLTGSGRGLGRQCARCEDTPMGAANLGVVPVDLCGGCGGVYLDSSELEPATRKKIQSGAAQSQVSRYTTRCVGCGEVFSPDLLTATTNGLACGSCYGRQDFATSVPLMPGRHGSGNPYLPTTTGLTEGSKGGPSILDGLIHLLDLFY